MSTLLQRRAASAMVLALLLFVGCSKSTTAPSTSTPSQVSAKTEETPQIIPAKTAFWPMYTAAHQWAPDVVVLRVTAKELPGYKNEAGKAALWEGAFASASKRQYRVFTYSIATVAPNIYKGVEAGMDRPWGGVTRDVMPVDLSQFTVDSDAAFSAAAADAEAWLKKNPAKQLTAFEIADSYRFQAPVWYVMWGDKSSGYVALVDASSGKVLSHK